MDQRASGKPAIFRAIFTAFAGFFLWTVADAIIRYLRDYSPLSIAMLAALSSVFWLCVFSPWLGGLQATFKKPKLKLQWMRGLVLACCSVSTFIAFMHLEMPKAYAIIFLTPILAKFFSVLINKERITLVSWCITLLGFLGVLIVLRPGTVPIELGSVAALVAAGAFALGYVMGRTIGVENQTTLSLSLFLNIWMIVILTAPGIQAFTFMPFLHIALALFIGLIGAVGELLVSLAYARAPAAYVAPVQYTQMIWGIIWSALLFKEYPDVWTIAGGAVVTGAGLLLVWQSWKVESD